MRGHDGVCGRAAPVLVPHEEQPEAEEDVDGELGLHDEEVGRGDDFRHKALGDVSEGFGMFGEVTQHVDPQPGEAVLPELGHSVDPGDLVEGHDRLEVDRLPHDVVALVDEAVQLEEDGRGQDGHHVGRLHRDLVLVERAEGQVERLAGDVGVADHDSNAALAALLPRSGEHRVEVPGLEQVVLVKKKKNVGKCFLTK